MAFFVRNTHRTFSAIFKKTIANSQTQFAACNGIDLPTRALHTSHVWSSINPRLTPVDEVDLNSQPNIKVIYNPPEWKYVERILPKPTVPSIKPKAEYSSGWVPPKPDGLKQPYFVRRSRNHMIPVYLRMDRRCIKKQTYIKHISGDIWALYHELMDHIEYWMAKKERAKVNEFNQQIIFNGDHVNLIKDFLMSKGF